MVAPGIGLVHASADVYPHPELFDPDRMVGATLGPTTWLPFGGGNRRCLGATFAMVEMRVVLREILRRASCARRQRRASVSASSTSRWCRTAARGFVSVRCVTCRAPQRSPRSSGTSTACRRSASKGTTSRVDS